MMRIQASPLDRAGRPGFAILALLHPREHTRFVGWMLGFGLLIGTFEQRWLGWPLWRATATILLLMLIPGVVKWRSDLRRYGWTTTLFGILVAAQGFHGIEHLVQWLQYHVLHWSPRESTGLLSAANSEWVHFVWNWIVLSVLLTLLYRRTWSIWFCVLLCWTTLHTFEHTYMFVRYLDVLAELRRMGFSVVTAQGLPGVLGRDGWLAHSTVTQGSFVCRIPGLTTAPRLDIHFWWNIGETILLLLAANTYLHQSPRRG